MTFLRTLLEWAVEVLSKMLGDWIGLEWSGWTRSLKSTHMGRGPKQVWGDQKAGGPENLLPLRAEGIRVSI